MPRADRKATAGRSLLRKRTLGYRVAQLNPPCTFSLGLEALDRNMRGLP
jgi:hypothetical protein